jgi:hypothetical protein
MAEKGWKRHENFSGFAQTIRKGRRKEEHWFHVVKSFVVGRQFRFTEWLQDRAFSTNFWKFFKSHDSILSRCFLILVTVKSQKCNNSRSRFICRALLFITK